MKKKMHRHLVSILELDRQTTAKKKKKNIYIDGRINGWKQLRDNNKNKYNIC